jgi:hypothetical protein
MSVAKCAIQGNQCKELFQVLVDMRRVRELAEWPKHRGQGDYLIRFAVVKAV